MNLSHNRPTPAQATHLADALVRDCQRRILAGDGTSTCKLQLWRAVWLAFQTTGKQL